MHTIMLPELAGTTGRPLIRGLYKALRALGNLFAMMFGLVPIIFFLQLAMGKLNMDAQGLLVLFLVFLVFAVLTWLCWGLARILPGRLFTPADWFLTMAGAFERNDHPGMKAAAKPLVRIDAATAQEHLFVALAHEVLARSEKPDDQWQEAADHYGEAADLGLNTLSLRVRRVRALEKAGSPDKVISYIQSLENSTDTDSELWFVKAQMLLKKGDVEGARQTLEHLQTIAGCWPGKEEQIRNDAAARLDRLGKESETERNVTPKSGSEAEMAQWIDKCGENEDGWRKIVADFEVHPKRTGKIIAALREGLVGERGMTAGIRAIHEFIGNNATVLFGLIVIGSILAWGGTFLLASAAVAIVEGKADLGFFNNALTLERGIQFFCMTFAIIFLGLAIVLIIKQKIFHGLIAGHFSIPLKTKVLYFASSAAFIIGTLIVTLTWESTATNHREILTRGGIIAPLSEEISTYFKLSSFVWEPKEPELEQLWRTSEEYDEKMRSEMFATLDDHTRSLEKLRIYMIPGDKGKFVFALVSSVVRITGENLLHERQGELDEANRKGLNISVEELTLVAFAGKEALREIVNYDYGGQERSIKILLNSSEYVEYRMISYRSEDIEACNRLYRMGLESIHIVDGE